MEHIPNYDAKNLFSALISCIPSGYSQLCREHLVPRGAYIRGANPTFSGLNCCPGGWRLPDSVQPDFYLLASCWRLDFMGTRDMINIMDKIFKKNLITCLGNTTNVHVYAYSSSVLGTELISAHVVLQLGRWRQRQGIEVLTRTSSLSCGWLLPRCARGQSPTTHGSRSFRYDPLFRVVTAVAAHKSCAHAVQSYEKCSDIFSCGLRFDLETKSHVRTKQ